MNKHIAKGSENLSASSTRHPSDFPSTTFYYTVIYVRWAAPAIKSNDSRRNKKSFSCSPKSSWRRVGSIYIYMSNKSKIVGNHAFGSNTGQVCIRMDFRIHALKDKSGII